MMEHSAKYKQIVIAHLASLILLSTLFLATSITHYEKIDYEYFMYALPRIIAISLVPAFMAWAIKVQKWYWSLVLGCVVGFICAALFIQLSISI